MNELPPIQHNPFITMTHSQLWIAVATSVFLILFAALTVLLIRKSLSPARDQSTAKVVDRLVNQSASQFATASMQAMIEKLRTQQKELASHHLLAQERAQQSEHFAEEITRNMPAGLLLVNATGSIASANAAAEDALGVRSLRYRGYREILGADSELTRMLVECFTTGRASQRDQLEHLTPAGDVRCLRVTISPIHRSGNTTAVRERLRSESHATETKPSSALCLISDLTELAALQKQLRWKENLAALGEMSAGIAHEFKNALGTISAQAKMILNQAQPGDVRDCSVKILQQTDSLRRVVAEFVRFATPLEICYAPIIMQDLIEQLAEQLRESLPEISVAVEGDFAEVQGDADLIRQALLNLTQNAADAAGGASSPSITIFGTIEYLGGRKWQRIGVADNGAGIPEHDLPKIFLPFYTTKSKGAGLGLAVVQKVALQHGGTIEARNCGSAGAEFLLWLPLRHEPSAPSIDTGHGASKI